MQNMENLISNLRNQLNSTNSENKRLMGLINRQTETDLPSPPFKNLYFHPGNNRGDSFQLTKLQHELNKKDQEMMLWKAKYERLKGNQNPVLFEDSDKFDLLQSNHYFSDNKPTDGKTRTKGIC